MSGKSLAAGLSSLILGVFSAVLAWFGYYAVVGIAIGMVGIIISSLTLKAYGSPLVVTGLVFSIIGCVCGLIGTLVTAVCAACIAI